jgi:CubicO group peptidase (beta-lactamase class C family)
VNEKSARLSVAPTRLAGVLAAGISLAASAIAQTSVSGPSFRADGPEMAIWSQNGSFPNCPVLTYLTDKTCRVSAFSDYGRLFPSRPVKAPAQASPLKRAPTELQVEYQFAGSTRTIDDYLNTYPVTGLLIARDDTILFERYQYGRTDKQPLTSFSMAKTIVGLLTGFALESGAIKSIDDTAETYVPELTGTEYGRTPIKALLLMSSGVWFSEIYSSPASDIYELARLTLLQDPAGVVGALPRFNDRVAPPGQRFSYSSAESLVLGLVVARATRRTIADLAQELLWQPLGAEADASWNIDAKGQEVTYAYYNAVLRDWARLGLMLAHGGKWAGRQIVPQKWVEQSTTVQSDWPSPTYGYHVWMSQYDRTSFYLSGLRGQFVLVNPALRIVVVQTSLENYNNQTQELTALTLATHQLFK